MRTIPSRRRSLADVHFAGFPTGGGLWWLRWFDYGGDGGGVTGTSKLRVVFSRLEGHPSEDALPVLDARLAASRMPQATAYVQAGWLPVLSIGLVARDGRVVGQLGATVERFAFPAKTHRAHIEPLMAPPAALPGRAPVPGRRTRVPAEADRPLALTRFAYPLEGVERGHLLSIRGGPGDAHLVLPCPEVLRAAYAPHRILALALLGGPWEATVRGVLDPGETYAVRGDGATDPHWLVAPAEGLGAAHVTVAANLWLNPAGRLAAGRIWTAILGQSGGAIEAALPFEWDALVVEVACLALPSRGPGLPPATFGYAITSIRWPDPPFGPPPRIESIPTRTEREPGPEGPTEPDGRPGYPRVVAVPDGDAAVLEGVQHLDASAGPSVAVEADGVMWSNAPEVVRAPPRPAGSTKTRRGPATVEETPRVSAGAGGRGRTGAATAQAQALDRFGGGDHSAGRFTRVLEMLDGLVKDGSISSHVEVAPPRTQAARRPCPAAPHGSLAVWALPEVPVVTGRGTERWHMLLFRHRPPLYADVRRTAMVRSIVAGASVVHWIETEPRGSGDRFHSLVFSQGGTLNLTATVTALLEVAAGRQGVWPEPEAIPGLPAFEGRPGVARTALWVHRRAGRGVPAVAAGGDASDVPYNRATALAAILKAARA